MSDREKQVVYQGPGVCGLLLVAFVVLKLVGVINWSWWWVISPLWIPLAISLVLLLILGVVIALNTR